MHIEAAALQQVVFAISSHKCPPPICIKLTPTLVADYVCHDRFFVREAGNVLDDHNNNYDDGYPAYSHHDKIPPWWGNVSNDKGVNIPPYMINIIGARLFPPDDQCLYLGY